MRVLLFVVATLLAASNYDLMQNSRRVQKENESLTALMHQQQKTGNALLDSLVSCRDTNDFLTTHNQVKVLVSLDDRDPIELRRARLDKKLQVKPVVLKSSPLNRNAEDVRSPVTRNN